MAGFTAFVYPFNMSSNHDESTSTPSSADAQQQTLPRRRLAEVRWPPRRRVLLPIILFFLTCLSTFWVGANLWLPTQSLESAAVAGNFMSVRQAIIAHWPEGLVYMLAVLTILMLHEMGHFIATIYYRVPASFPFFLPFPFNPIGTLGAVIGMHGNLADRKQIFDIGIAGPLAGLVAAVPLTFVGIAQLDLTTQPLSGIGIRMPLLMHLIASWMQIEGYVPGEPVWINQLNPIFIAAWVGLLITGLNMMPVGQLDGGHVTYTLFGKAAHWIARLTIMLAIAFMVYHQSYILIIMVVLVLLVGTSHPPTRDDSVPLGPFRWLLGLASLSIPVLCFPPLVFELIY
ncbi:MAG: site-2 protease family protein [Planctomycetota bacterium]